MEEIFQTYLKATKDDLESAANKLKEKTPAPMNSMLQKQPKEEAIQKREKRRSMVVVDVPPTTPGTFLFCELPFRKSLYVAFMLLKLLVR